MIKREAKNRDRRAGSPYQLFRCRVPGMASGRDGD
jgi:hypothetical protein